LLFVETAELFDFGSIPLLRELAQCVGEVARRALDAGGCRLQRLDFVR
jgi:hypothetical protein